MITPTEKYFRLEGPKKGNVALSYKLLYTQENQEQKTCNSRIITGVELRKNVHSSNRTSELGNSLVRMKFNSSDYDHIFENTNVSVSRLSTESIKPKVITLQILLHRSNQTYHVVNIEPAILYNKQFELMRLLYSDFCVITISFHD